MFAIMLLAGTIWHICSIWARPWEKKSCARSSSMFSWSLLLRIFGKRELAQLNPFDLVVLLSLSNTVQNAIIGDDNSVSGGIIGAFTLVAINYGVVRFLFKHRRLDQILEGSPTVLIENGTGAQRSTVQRAAHPLRVDDRAAPAGFGNIADVDHCVLEPGGVFFIKPKEPPPADRQHAELVAKLDELTRQVAALSVPARASDNFCKLIQCRSPPEHGWVPMNSSPPWARAAWGKCIARATLA